MSNVKDVVSATMMQFEEEVVERRLTFKPDPSIGNLCLGMLDDVRIDVRKSPKLLEDGTENTWEYAGFDVPTIVLTFKQCKTKENPKDRYYTFSVKPVTTVDKDGNPVDPKKLIGILQQEYTRLRHIANQYKGLKNYNTELGQCPGIDYAASPATRLEQYTAFFNYFKNLLVGVDENAPVYKGVRLWIKLVAEFSSGKYLAFPGFVGRGFVERVIEGQEPTIDFEANETVQLTKSSNASRAENAVAKAAPQPAGVSDDVQSIIDKYSN